MKKLIYEMKYPHADYTKENKYDIEDEEEKLALSELLKGRQADTQYTPIPKRLEESEEFIEMAIRISKLYQTDIRIYLLREKISAYLAFDFGTDMKDVSRLFGIADGISFFKDSNERDLAVCLDFYTHVVVRNGLAIAP